jgi:GxxExxY protein
MKYKDLTGRIIGAAMEVHKHLGNGFQEVIYQRALSIELNMQNIHHEREKEMSLEYKGFDIGTRRVDFFVENKIMVEIKAVINLEDVHLAQAMNYVEAYNMEIGLLLNFGAKSLQFKRVHNNKLLSKSSHRGKRLNLDEKDALDRLDYAAGVNEKSSHQVNQKNQGSDK